MRTFAVLYRKEIAAFFSSPTAYVVIAVFLVIMGYSFTLKLFITHSQTLVDLFFQMFVLILLTVPIITMRLVAEERKLGTLEVLLTSPVTEAKIILAKFAASLTLVALMLGLSTVYAGVLGLYGDPDWGPIATALVGVGLLSSTLTNNQIIAAVLSLSVFLLLWIIDEVAPLLPVPLNDVALHLSLSGHFKPFATGSLYLSDVAFFLSAALLALFLSVRALLWR
jgi:ABC-2 type transport system permease protein